MGLKKPFLHGSKLQATCDKEVDREIVTRRSSYENL